jgi:hypothetical protein
VLVCAGRGEPFDMHSMTRQPSLVNGPRSGS